MVKKQEMSKEEQIGFHKGSLNSLIKERQELYRLISIVDELIRAHSQALQKLGVKFSQKEQTKDEPLERKL